MRWVALGLVAVAVVARGAGPVYGQAVRYASADRLLTGSGVAWSSAESMHFRLHTERGSPAERAVRDVSADAEAARKEVLGLLDLSGGPRIDLFYVSSLDRMESLIGVRAKAWSIPAARFAVFVYNARVSAHHRHELSHLLAEHAWGPAASPAHWINEGLAQYAEGGCGDLALDAATLAMVRVGRGVSARALVETFERLPPLDARVAAGSLVGFLVGSFGVERIEALWRHGVGRFDALYGVPFDEAVGLWQTHLGKADSVAREVDWDEVSREGCG